MAICPLLLIAVKTPTNLITDPEKEWSKCLMAECEWWDEEFKACMITNIHKILKIVKKQYRHFQR